MKTKNLINKYLNTKAKKITAICVVATLIITCAGGIIYSLNITPSLVLKKNNFTIEYGESFNPDFKTLVDTEGLNEEDKHYLQHSVKIKSNIENEVETVINPDGTTSEKDRGFAKVGDYKITLTYQNEEITVNVKVRDTVAPQLSGPDNIEIIQGTDLTTFDFKSLISATDLSQLNDVIIDYSAIDTNILGEYKVKASVEDVNKNKAEKEFKVTVVVAPLVIEQESTTNMQTNTATNKKGSTNNSNRSSNNTNSSSSSSSNKGNSNSGSTENNGNTDGSNSGNTGESSGGETKPEEPNPPKIKIYWAKCGCGYYIESTISIDDVKNKLYLAGHGNGNNGISDNGDCYHYSFGVIER